MPVRTVRHTVASNDMQHIDLCEPDNMPVNNMALELLSPQHEAMINWRILRASANNGCMRVCVRPRMKKGYIHSNNENNQNKWCAACGCAESCLGILCTVVPLNGMVCTDTRRSRSRMNMCMRVRFGACLCGIVGTYLCCHGLRCGSSTRRPGHGKPDSRCFSVSPCRRLRTGHEKLEGIVRTFGNLPARTERLEPGGAGGMHALRVRTDTKAAAPASANALSG